MGNQVRPYEPLTSENAALILVDHQVGLMTGVRDYSTGELKHNVVALAKAAKARLDARIRAFEDFPEPERKRHLLRVWLAPSGARNLPRVYAERFVSITQGDRGGVGVKRSRPTMAFM